MSVLNENSCPTIHAVEGFNPADYVRVSVEEDGSRDAYLDAKFRILWFRLHRPNGKIDTEVIHLDEKSAFVCCRVYADRSDAPDQFIGKAHSHRFATQDAFGDRYLEVAETIAKSRALADAGYGTQFCITGEASVTDLGDAPIHMPPEDTGERPLGGGAVNGGIVAEKETIKQSYPAEGVLPSMQDKPKTVDELLKAMTIQQAKAVTVDFGKYAGQTLGEIAMRDPVGIQWYADKYSGRNIALKAGAILLVNAARGKAG